MVRHSSRVFLPHLRPQMLLCCNNKRDKVVCSGFVRNVVRILLLEYYFNNSCMLSLLVETLWNFKKKTNNFYEPSKKIQSIFEILRFRILRRETLKYHSRRVKCLSRGESIQILFSISWECDVPILHCHPMRMLKRDRPCNDQMINEFHGRVLQCR